MRKVLFFMFLLLLMGLGAAGVKAQVRIGGNGAPNAAAVLDLNATDGTNNGTKGLALPRVSLSSNTAQITSGVANLTGMLVYNTTATLGGAGIYYWNGSSWAIASLPPFSAADSGMRLMFNGTSWIPALNILSVVAGPYTAQARTYGVATWSKVLDTSFTFSTPTGKIYKISAPGVVTTDLCTNSGDPVSSHAGNGEVYMWSIVGGGMMNASYTIRCYRASF